MTITRHATLPFVEIGTENAIGQRYGLDKAGDWSGSDNAWMYVIDGKIGQFVCQDLDHAREMAEEELCVHDADLFDTKARELRASGQIDQLLVLTELKGFWRGKAAMRSEAAAALKPVMDFIGRLSA